MAKLLNTRSMGIWNFKKNILSKCFLLYWHNLSQTGNPTANPDFKYLMRTEKNENYFLWLFCTKSYLLVCIHHLRNVTIQNQCDGAMKLRHKPGMWLLHDIGTSLLIWIIKNGKYVWVRKIIWELDWLLLFWRIF